MDDVVGGFFVLLIGACLVALYVLAACAALVAGTVVLSIDSVGFTLWRLGAIFYRAISNRGGDQRAPLAPEPAYEIYFGRPLLRDFLGGFSVIWSELLQKAHENRRRAFTRYDGAMLPLAIGITIGAYLGALIGMVLGGIIAALLGLMVVVVASVVWFGSRALQLAERLRRRIRGAHFDCPSCQERSPLPVYVCPTCGAKHRDLLPGRWGIRRRRCECDTTVLGTLESTGRHALPAECPRCDFPMPGAGGIVPELAFPIIGGPRAGKTAYLASLLVDLDDRTQAGAARLAVVDENRPAFQQLTGDLRAGRVPAKTQIQERTPAFVGEIRGSSKRSALFYAHDIAGELYQQADRVRTTPYLERARGVVLLLDPFSLRPVNLELKRDRANDAAAISPSDENPQSVLERFLQAVRETGRKDVGKLPVAVVVSKADALKSSSDPLSPGDSGKAVSEWLERNGAGNLVRLLDAEFEKCGFFASSALGRIPDSTSVPFAPVATVEPFEWLLKSNGVALNGATAPRETVTETLSSRAGAKSVTPFPRVPIYAAGQYTPAIRAGAGLSVVALLIGLIAVTASLADRSNDDAFASSGGGSEESAPTGGDTGEQGPTGSTETTTTPPPEADQDDEPRTRISDEEPAQVLYKHFRRIDNGEYDAAFKLMTPSYRDRNPDWASLRSDAVPAFNVVAIGDPRYSGDEADVYVRFYARDEFETQGSDTKCRRFTGWAHLVKVGGVWRYDPLNNELKKSKITGDQSQCP